MNQKALLTQTVQKGGCAAKIPAEELREILSMVNFKTGSKDILVDGSSMDDAGVVQISADLALVQTLDFFTPIVDTPYLFGQIAAANALSDVYAMGGSPRTAMAILAVPLLNMSKEIIAEILQGASDKMAEAQTDLIGGHSIDDDTLKFGLSVTGYVHPQKIWKNSGARCGDRIILTKPLGTGTATAALKRQVVSEEDIQDEIKSMCQLNDIFNHSACNFYSSIHSATDITGFGLAGHVVQMARASQKTINLFMHKIPRFKKTEAFLRAGYLTKAHRTNKSYVSKEMQIESVGDIEQKLLCDPQTSGGLLLSVAEESSAALINHLHEKNILACEIGQVESVAHPLRVIISS